jgi:hypothetical protein
MDYPPPLHLIRLGNEWLVTNGEPAADGSIRFPENDPAGEIFCGNGVPPANLPPSQPPPPPAAS